jgi:monoamine oxidase
MDTEVLIVGGGLSGLHTAYMLAQRGTRVVLAEARDRLGGRILSREWSGADAVSVPSAFDLGPAWFWPHQRRIRALIDELGLAEQVFAQASEGDALFEDTRGALHRGVEGISMGGSYRLAGGLQRLVAKLAERIPAATILTSAQVTRVQQADTKIITRLLRDDGRAETIASDAVVLALPPRLAVTSIELEPPLTPARVRELRAIPTWMAGHAKVVTLYERPFWLEQGFSGDAISEVGPLREIHDASPAEGGPYALFGFVGAAAAERCGKERELRAEVTAQLARLFGEAARSPLHQFVKDWAAEPYTAIEADQAMLASHPSTGLTSPSEPSWRQRLVWSGSETASPRDRNNGYLEGALEASGTALERLRDRE